MQKITEIPSPAHSLDSLPPPGKMIPPSPNFYSPTKQQFSCYNPIKTSFLAVVVAPVLFPFDVQYLENGVFSFEKGLNGQNHSSTHFHHPMKKSLPSPKFPNPPLGGEISSLPL